MNAAVGLTYVRLGDLPELLLGTYFGGSWATRREGASQGGYLQFVVTRSAAESGAPVPLVVTDWGSKKVSRISRASLDVEAQAGVVAGDALDFSKLFHVGMFVPSVSMQDDWNESCRNGCESIVRRRPQHVSDPRFVGGEQENLH